MKRTFDCVVALVGLVVLSPVLLLAAALIKIESNGPVIFRQRRVGRHFKPFTIYKFRTMHPRAEGGQLTIGDDARITRVGKWLRLTKVDELPQLVNVLRGDMSLVGPRPEVPKYVDLYRAEYGDILRVRPGVTDLASLKYRHEALLLAGPEGGEQLYVSEVLADKIRLSREYIARSSFAFDLWLILKTIAVLLEPASSGSTAPTAVTPARRESEPFWPVFWLLRFRRAIVVGIHIALIIAANYGAFLLRFDGDIPPDEFTLFVQCLPLLVAVRGLTFVPLRLYEGLWRYTSLWDLRNILVGVTASSVVFFLLTRVAFATGYSRSVHLIDAILLVCAMSGIRLGRRLLIGLSRAPVEKRVLICGAGDAGEMVVREMLRHPQSGYTPVGFIDEDPEKVGRRIHGVPVLGRQRDLARLIADTHPSEVIVALPDASKAAVRGLVKALEPFSIPIATLPTLNELLGGRVIVDQVRPLEIDDLLERRPIGLDAEPVRELIEGRSVMVTGAGGSIGSELCKQIAALNPAKLLLFERSENSLFSLANELADSFPATPAVLVVGDVANAERVDAVMAAHRPHVVFHAAAHKHVPLMELSPCEAVRNNVLGTRTLAEAAIAHGVDRFVLISSDKAVNPSSVMGTTKRVAELVTRALNDFKRTRFVTVRFGNVLRSNGSVVPRFIDQIRAGGPVTVTHPEVRRYFMLISEAVHLVLHAAAIDDGGGLYVLEMGDQIKLVDLARNLVRLAGYVPEQEIRIAFTGLRPGEKLFEELIGPGETAQASGVLGIMRVRTDSSWTPDTLAAPVMMLERAALDENTEETLARLRVLVPDYLPDRVVREAATSVVTVPSRARSWHPRIDRRAATLTDRRQTRRDGRRREDQRRMLHRHDPRIAAPDQSAQTPLQARPAPLDGC